jgi:outer membrane protein OmpA-like peptidoglycan-associated protein
LFQVAPNGLETLTPAGRKRIDEFATRVGDGAAGSAVVIEGYSNNAKDHDDQFGVSRNRAILVSQYLRTHFRLDAQSVGVVSLLGQPPPGAHKDQWDGICIVILK